MACDAFVMGLTMLIFNADATVMFATSSEFVVGAILMLGTKLALRTLVAHRFAETTLGTILRVLAAHGFAGSRFGTMLVMMAPNVLDARERGQDTGGHEEQQQRGGRHLENNDPRNTLRSRTLR